MATDHDYVYDDKMKALFAHLKATTPGVPTGNPDVRIYHVSPSMISSFTQCERKAYAKYVLKIEEPPKPSAELGTRCHKLIEDYGNGVIDRIPTTPDGKIVLPGVAKGMLPNPERVANGLMALEEVMMYKEPDLPVPYVGKIDEIDYEFSIVGDHKTSVNPEKYAKSAQELENGEYQAVIYGNYALSIGLRTKDERNREYVNFRHNNFKTKSPFMAFRTEARLYVQDRMEGGRLVAEGLENQLKRVNAKANEMLAVFGETNEDDVPYNTGSCMLFGPCHLRDHCRQRGVPVDGERADVYAAVSNISAIDKEVTYPMAGPNFASIGAKAQAAHALAAADKQEGPTGAAPAAPAGPSKPAFAGAPGGGMRPVARNVVVPVPPPINPPDGFSPKITDPDETKRLQVPPTPDGEEDKLNEFVENKAAEVIVAKQAEKDAKKNPLLGIADGAPKAGGKLPGGKKKDIKDAEPAAQSVFAALLPDTIGNYDAATQARALEDGAWIVAKDALVKADQAAAEAVNTLREANEAVAGADNDADVETSEAAQAAATAANNKAVRVAKAALTAAATAATAALTAAQQALAAEAAAAAQQKTQAPAAGKRAAAEQGTSGSPRLLSPRVLYLRCSPNCEHTLWENFIAPVIQKACVANHVGHIRTIPFDANAKILAELAVGLKDGSIELPQHLVFIVGSGLHDSFLETMIPFYDIVVR